MLILQAVDNKVEYSVLTVHKYILYSTAYGFCSLWHIGAVRRSLDDAIFGQSLLGRNSSWARILRLMRVTFAIGCNLVCRLFSCTYIYKLKILVLWK